MTTALTALSTFAAERGAADHKAAYGRTLFGAWAWSADLFFADMCRAPGALGFDGEQTRAAVIAHREAYEAALFDS